MNVFTTLLAKDLREQRLSLLAPWGLGLLACAATALLVDPSWLDTPVFAQVLALTLGSLCALAIGCDVGSRERGEGSLSWLLRQPFGFGQVIVSKLAVLMLGMLFGLCAGALFAYATSASVASGGAAFDFGRTEGVLVLIVIALGLWTTSASTWMPRGFLAAPAGIVSFVLVAAPAWIPFVWYELRPDPIVWKSLVLALPLGGLFAAIAGLSTGVRTAAGPARRASWALGAGALGCVPLWFTATQQTLDVLRFDPTSEAFHITGAYLGAPGTHALLQTTEGRVDWRRRLVDGRPIVVELATGEWRAVGPRGSTLRALSGTEAWLVEDLTGVVTVVRHDGTEIALDQLPDSSAIEQARGPEPPAGLRLQKPAGLGWQVRATGREPYDGFFDPASGAVFAFVELRRSGLEFQPTRALSTGDVWILVGTGARRGKVLGERYALYDSANRQISTPDWLASLRQVVGVMSDGRVLAVIESDGRALCAFVDATSGKWTEIPVANAPDMDSLRLLAGVGSGPLDETGSPMAFMRTDRPGTFWLQADGTEFLTSELSAAPSVVGELGPGELLVTTHPDSALWSYTFDGRAPRKLFPR